MVPVLYASQWFLTVFSCPFPSAFACRIIDVILAEGHTEIMLQVSCYHTGCPSEVSIPLSTGLSILETNIHLFLINTMSVGGSGSDCRV